MVHSSVEMLISV